MIKAEMMKKKLMTRRMKILKANTINMRKIETVTMMTLETMIMKIIKIDMMKMEMKMVKMASQHQRRFASPR
jgi:hypothetical protein